MATLSVPASLEQLANVNAFIHETIPSSYRPLIPQVELAAEELLVNVFSYAYPDVPGEAQVAWPGSTARQRAVLLLQGAGLGSPFRSFP